MADYNAGIARAVYELEAAKAEATLQRLTKNTLAYETILKRVQQLGKTGLPGVGGSGAGGGAGAAAQANAAALAQQKLALTQQQTARTAAQLATEQQRLATEEQRTAQATTRAEQAQLRLAQAQQKTAQSGGRGAALPRTLDGLSGPAATIAKGFLTIQAFEKGFSLVRIGAQASDARRSLDGLAASAHTTGDAIIQSLRGAAQGTIRDSQLITSANTGVLLTQGRIARDLPQLVQIARASARATGQDVGFVFDSLVRGIARGSPLIIDNAGITLDAAGAFETYAKSVGKSVDQLTRQEQQQATLNAVLAAGSDIVKQVGLDANSSATQIDRAVTAVQNLGEALAQKIAPFVGTSAGGLANLLNTGSTSPDTKAAGDNLQGNLIRNAASFEDYAKSVRTSNDQISAAFANDPVAGALAKRTFGLQQLNPVEFAYAQSLIATGTAYAEAIKQARALGDASDLLTSQTQGTDTAFQALIPKMAAVSATGAENAGQVLALNSAYLQGQVSIEQVRIVLDALIKVQDQAREAAFQEERETRQLERSFVDIVPAASAAAAAIAGVANSASAGFDLSKFRIDKNDLQNATTGIAKGLGGGALDLSRKFDTEQRALQESRDQLALARARSSAERLAIFQRQLNRQTTEEGRNRILAQIEQEKRSTVSAASTASSKGLSSDTRADLKLIGDKQDRLREVNRLLAEGRLTELARKQLLIEQADLESDITSEIERQNQARVDAQLGTVRDAQARLKEAREARGLTRALSGGRLSSEQQTAAQLRLQEIQLEQQKRALDIDREIRASGGTPTGPLARAPLISAPSTPLVGAPGVPLGPVGSLASAQVVVNLSLTIDGKTGAVTQSNVDPGTILNLLGSATSFRNLSGGA